jgi:2-polyprenyl-3-methyl-5-hydroxy-6-metoxy-1,4-benzoquinol methylase
VTFEGDSYQAQFDDLASQGQDVHGEATFLRALEPGTVLDAGCGTGRVAIELARHGIEVVGTDVNPSMLDTARSLAPQLDWIEADLATLDLGRTFDVVVMAGNVLLFTQPDTEAAVVARCARHLEPNGALVAGFLLTRGYSLEEYDTACADAGLMLAERFATWDRDPFVAGGDYAVSVHQRR